MLKPFDICTECGRKLTNLNCSTHFLRICKFCEYPECNCYGEHEEDCRSN